MAAARLVGKRRNNCMCGIVGYVGTQQAAPILLEGLSRLEYRGYDSAGVCVEQNGVLKVEKAKGRLQNLIAKNRKWRASARHARHRPYPLGHARRAERHKFPPARLPERENRRRSQRHHRELSGTARISAAEGRQIRLTDRHGGRRAADGILHGPAGG